MDKRLSSTIYIGKDEITGKYITRTIHGKSKKEIRENKIKAIATFQRKLNYRDNDNVSLWADKWYYTQKDSDTGLAEGTKTQYKSAIKHIKSMVENKSFNDLSLDFLQNEFNKLARKNPTTHKPTAKSTLKSVLKTFKAITKYAKFNKIPGADDEIFTYIKIPRSSPVKKRRALTEEEINMVLETDHRAHTPSLIMLLCGLRKGELIPLQWKDVDFERKLLHVNKSVVFIKNQPKLSDGKTNNAIRFIPIPEYLYNHLLNLKKKTKAKKTDLICPNTQKKMYSKTSWDKMWKSYMTDLNLIYGYKDNEKAAKFFPFVKEDKIEKFTPHYLRHTYATLLFLQNVNVVTAKQYLGHANIQVTVDIYTDLENYNKAFLSKEFLNKLENELKIPTF